MSELSFLAKLAFDIVTISALLFAFVVLILIGTLIYFYIADVSQSKQAIRRNYPIIGRFRYLFEHLGEFFRQYFFAMDREELPFNRAQRSWVYRAAKNIDYTIAFGSTRLLNQPGDIIFLNSLIPVQSDHSEDAATLVFGEGYAKHPYATNAIINISAMSFGSLSVPAVKALSNGAKKANIWLNTGEGGLTEFHLDGNCDIVFQIGTAKYGVRDKHGKLSDEKLESLADKLQVKMFEIKLSQGAKPGKGGILPAEKVTELIATTRGIPVGKASISPNGHEEIHCIDDLLDMIVHVRNTTGKPTGFKAVIGQADWLDELCQAIQRRGLGDAPDFFTIDSADGGTGAAPQSLIDFMGLPIRRSLPLVVDKLNEYHLRDRIKVIVSGKLINPSDIAWALCMGADVINSGRGFMFSLGCIQAMQCNKNTCPTGITTHDEDLQKGLDPTVKAERVANYARNLVNEVNVIAHSCGVSEPRQLRRKHAQIINEHGIPEALDILFPDVIGSSETNNK